MVNFIQRVDDFIVWFTEPVRRLERRNATPLMREAEALQSKLATLLVSDWSHNPVEKLRNAIVRSKMTILQPYFTGENADNLAYSTDAAHCEEFFEEFQKVTDISAYIKKHHIQIKRQL